MELDNLEREINKILIDCDSPYDFNRRAALMGIMLKIKQYEMSKVQLPVRIESVDLEILKQYAKDDNRPLSNYVDTVLKTHIALKKQKREGKK